MRNLTAPKESLPRFEYPLPNYFVYPNQIMAGHSSGVCWLFRHPSQESYIFHWMSSHDPSFENNIEQMLRIIRGHSHRLKTGVITETILHDGQMYYLIKPHGSFAEKLWITFGNRMDKYHIDLIMRVLTSIDPGHTHAEECAVLLQTLAHMNAKIEVDFFPEEEEGVSKLGTYVFSCEKMLLFSIDHSAVMWATDIGKIRHILLSMLALTCQHIPRKKKPLLESVSAG